jgi:DNA-binding GntR family transcriptional regulator
MANGQPKIQSISRARDQLRDAILTGKLAPGAAAPQLELAKQFNIGRTPLREALRLLQTEGLIVGEPNRRTQISELTAADLEEINIMRILLETAAARLTIPNLSRSDVAELIGFMAQMDHYETAADWLGLRIPHKAFHAKFIAAAGARIVGQIDQLFDYAERYRLAYLPPARNWEVRQAEHKGLVDAAAERDVDEVITLLTGHYLHTASLVMTSLDPNHASERLFTVVESVAPNALRAGSYQATSS